MVRLQNSRGQETEKIVEWGDSSNGLVRLQNSRGQETEKIGGGGGD